MSYDPTTADICTYFGVELVEGAERAVAAGHQLPVFDAERRDGLERTVASSGRLLLAAIALPDVPSQADVARAQLQRANATNLDQADLFYLKSILATTGINRNDDYFDRLETWAARKTPEDKPFNFEHRQDDIIGHITACSVVDGDGEVVANDLTDDKVPDKFHVLTTAVIYKFCDVPERQKLIDKTLKEVAAGKWYVSMECLFKGFDYVLIPEGSTKGTYDLAQATVVERNDKTAFLTKHLRAYGGKGVWNGQQVGRVLRNILFHGKGLVKKPANPDSLIFSMENEPLSGAAATSEGAIASLTTNNKRNTTMSVPDAMDESFAVAREVAEYMGVKKVDENELRRFLQRDTDEWAAATNISQQPEGPASVVASDEELAAVAAEVEAFFAQDEDDE